jgi:hypothetical protein
MTLDVRRLRSCVPSDVSTVAPCERRKASSVAYEVEHEGIIVGEQKRRPDVTTRRAMTCL